VFDLDVIDLVRLAATMRSEGRSLGGQEISPAPRFFVGVADLPLAVGTDPARLEREADAGAEFVQTQIVYDVDAFGEWAESIRPRGLFERMFVLAGLAGVHVMGLGREHAVRRVIADAGRLPRPAAV
jgi:methylenetetrahydrofolate reductase (NADPH)